MSYETDLKKKELLQRQQGQKANLLGKLFDDTPKQDLTQPNWEEISKNAPKLGIHTDATNIQTASEAAQIKPNQEATKMYNEVASKKEEPKKPNLGVTALESLAKFGKNMSENQPKIEAPKFNAIDTKVDENSDLLAIKKAILARMVGR